jgi:HEAT repeat protein
MHARLVVSLFATASLLAQTARAAVDAVAPLGGGLGALAVHVDLGDGRVGYQPCPQALCTVGPSSPQIDLKVDPSALPAPQDVVTEVVPISGGKHLVHVRVPLRGEDDPVSPAWEGLFAAGGPPIFAAFTGWTRGERGERTGVALRILDAGDAKTVVVGDIREDLTICGDAATLLRPRGLDPATLTLVGATLQRLSKERRAKATGIIATGGGASADAPLAPLLAAEGASSAIGQPKALTDGDPQSTWSEARPGQGQGEYVFLRAPHEVPITRFAIAIAPSAPKAEGAAPRTFYLATDSTTYKVTLPEDGWLHPNVAYDVPLPDPVRTSCVALVLDEAYARGNAHPEVTVAELYAYSEWDVPAASLATVAGDLKGGGARAEAAAGVLKRAGDRGVAAAAAAYGALDAAGRALAVDVAASAQTCVTSAEVLTRALADSDEVVRAKALAKLEQPHCGHEAVSTLIAALGDPGTRARAAVLLASISPSQALAPIANVLGQGSARERGAIRSALARAAVTAPTAALALLVSQERAPDARIELLRATEEQLGIVKEAADSALEQLLSGDPSLRTRYLLAAPVAALAKAGDAKDEDRLVGLLTRDKDAMVRAHAAELAGASPTTQAALREVAADSDPRVRDAALRTVASARVASAQAAATKALTDDPWTFVRASAAAALAALAVSEPSDRALRRGVEDPSPSVRSAAILALATHKAVAFADPIRSRVIDPSEDPEVRVAAAHALGALCDARAVDKLVEYALLGASSPDPNDVALGLAATAALGELHPADLERRLQKIRGKGNRPDAQRAAAAAIADRGACR